MSEPTKESLKKQLQNALEEKQRLLSEKDELSSRLNLQKLTNKDLIDTVGKLQTHVSKISRNSNECLLKFVVASEENVELQKDVAMVVRLLREVKEKPLKLQEENNE